VKKNVVGVSGINATDNPGAGCAVARSLIAPNLAAQDLVFKKTEPKVQSSPLVVVGLSYDVNDPGNYMSDIFSNSFLMPYPNKGWEVLAAALDEIQQKTGLNILLPCLDAELPLMIKHKDELAKMGFRTLLPDNKQLKLCSKDRLYDLARQIDCRHPRTKAVYSMYELAEVLKNEIFLPAVIKGKYYQAHIVYSMENALAKATEIVAQWGFPLLVQEKITGQEINMVALSNFNGCVKGRLSIRKQLTTHFGKVWTAVTIRDAMLDKICDNFANYTKWSGPFELECIINKEGIYLIEINPRFPSWVYFATALGINLPQMLVQIIETGDCKSNFDYPLEKYLVRYTAEFATDLCQFQNLLSYKNRNGL
jgi:carbamoyl-phosphate synthase large subunit